MSSAVTRKGPDVPLVEILQCVVLEPAVNPGSAKALPRTAMSWEAVFFSNPTGRMRLSLRHYVAESRPVVTRP